MQMRQLNCLTSRSRMIDEHTLLIMRTKTLGDNHTVLENKNHLLMSILCWSESVQGFLETSLVSVVAAKYWEYDDWARSSSNWHWLSVAAPLPDWNSTRAFSASCRCAPLLASWSCLHSSSSFTTSCKGKWLPWLFQLCQSLGITF